MPEAKEARVLRMLDIVSFRGFLKVLGSGLHIGGTKEAIEIGECDNPIIRHPITGVPYVPGSSVKGKIRCLLEQRSPDYKPSERGAGPCICGKCLVCKLFGCGNPASNVEAPTRLVFRDAPPTDDTVKWWRSASLDGEIVTEMKSEVQIDRKTGRAGGGGPRTMERIPAGSDFNFSFSLRTFEGDDVPKYYKVLAEGFELLSKHYLGGSGSRGYGEVLIVNEDGTPMHEHLRKLAEAG